MPIDFENNRDLAKQIAEAKESPIRSGKYEDAIRINEQLLHPYDHIFHSPVPSERVDQQRLDQKMVNQQRLLDQLGTSEFLKNLHQRANQLKNGPQKELLIEFIDGILENIEQEKTITQQEKTIIHQQQTIAQQKGLIEQQQRLIDKLTPR